MLGVLLQFAVTFTLSVQPGFAGACFAAKLAFGLSGIIQG